MGPSHVPNPLGCARLAYSFLFSSIRVSKCLSALAKAAKETSSLQFIGDSNPMYSTPAGSEGDNLAAGRYGQKRHVEAPSCPIPDPRLKVQVAFQPHF